MDKLKKIRKVHYSEIPSVHYDMYSNLTLKNGLHLNIIYDKSSRHKMYLPESFETNLNLYGLYKSKWSQYDLIAFHIYHYLMLKINTKYQWKVLWKLLSYSNSFIVAIVKTIKLLNAYHKFDCK